MSPDTVYLTCDCPGGPRVRGPHVSPCIYAPEPQPCPDCGLPGQEGEAHSCHSPEQCPPSCAVAQPIREEGEAVSGAAPFAVIPTDDEDDWRERRREGVGASDSPVILGASTFSSRVKIYTEKIGELPPWEGSEKTEAGKRKEPYLAATLAENLEAERWELDGRLYRSARWPTLQCTPDAWLWHPEEGRTLVELKNTDRHSDWSDGPPPGYWTQCQHQLAVTGEERMLIAVEIAGWKFRWAWIERDESFILETLLPECEAFWSCVQARRLPPLDASKHTAQALAVLFPEAEKGELIDLPGEFVDLDADYEHAKKMAKAFEEQADFIKNQLREAIGSAEGGRVRGGALWKWAGKNGRRSLRRYGKDD